MITLDQINFTKSGGLIPAIAQDAETRAVLMLGWQNPEAVQKTIDSNFLWFYSRSRQTLWQKGESSGNLLRVVETCIDCDGDTLLYSVVPAGSTCHTGQTTCFGEPTFDLRALDRLIQQRLSAPKPGSYTNELLADSSLALAKMKEESAEVIQAVEEKEGRERVIWEGSDLIYHLFVLLASQGVHLADIESALHERHF